MPKARPGVFSLRATGKLGGHRRPPGPRPPSPPPTGLYVARRGGAEFYLPFPAPPRTVISGALSWQPGAWTLISGLLTNFYLSSLMAVTSGMSNLTTAVIELSYGPTPTPLDVARRVVLVFNPGPGTVLFFAVDHPQRPICVPGPTSLFARATTTVSAPVTFEVSLVGWGTTLPTWTEIPTNVPAGPGRFYPSNLAIQGTPVVLGGPWVYGASSTVDPAVPNDLLVHQLELQSGIGEMLNAAMFLQVGYGPDGAETWCATVPIAHLHSPALIWPPVLILSGERLALRGATAFQAGYNLYTKVYDL